MDYGQPATPAPVPLPGDRKGGYAESLDHRHGCFHQSLDPRRLLGLFDRREAAARLADNFRHEIGCHRMGVAKPVIELARKHNVMKAAAWRHLA
jgi:hypothetical protein